MGPRMIHLLSQWYAASLAYIELWYKFAVAARLYIDVADFIHFYCFFISSETILSCAKFALGSSNHDSFAKNEKEKEVVVRM